MARNACFTCHRPQCRARPYGNIDKDKKKSSGFKTNNTQIDESDGENASKENYLALRKK